MRDWVKMVYICLHVLIFVSAALSLSCLKNLEHEIDMK